MRRREQGVERPRRHIPNDYDLKTSLREWCTCPKCFIVWEHPETTNDGADWQWVKVRYGGIVTCDACGARSVPEPRNHKHGLAKVLGNDMRRLFDEPTECSPPILKNPSCEEREP